MLTVQSTNYGQLILFSPFDINAPAETRLRELEATHAVVKVSGTLSTVCAMQQLRSGVTGCRRCHTTKAIIIERPKSRQALLNEGYRIGMAVIFPIKGG